MPIAADVSPLGRVNGRTRMPGGRLTSAMARDNAVAGSMSAMSSPRPTEAKTSRAAWRGTSMRSAFHEMRSPMWWPPAAASRRCDCSMSAGAPFMGGLPGGGGQLPPPRFGWKKAAVQRDTACNRNHLGCKPVRARRGRSVLPPYSVRLQRPGGPATAPSAVAEARGDTCPPPHRLRGLDVAELAQDVPEPRAAPSTLRRGDRYNRWNGVWLRAVHVVRGRHVGHHFGQYDVFHVRRERDGEHAALESRSQRL